MVRLCRPTPPGAPRRAARGRIPSRRASTVGRHPSGPNGGAHHVAMPSPESRPASTSGAAPWALSVAATTLVTAKRPRRGVAAELVGDEAEVDQAGAADGPAAVLLAHQQRGPPELGAAAPVGRVEPGRVVAQSRGACPAAPARSGSGRWSRGRTPGLRSGSGASGSLTLAHVVLFVLSGALAALWVGRAWGDGCGEARRRSRRRCRRPRCACATRPWTCGSRRRRGVDAAQRARPSPAPWACARRGPSRRSGRRSPR